MNRYLARSSALLFVLASLSLAPHAVQGQSYALNGQIEGNLIDRFGASVSGASVSLMNIDTGAARKTETNDDGLFRFPILPLGTYRISISAKNFKTVVRGGVTLVAGQTAKLSLVLETGDVSETVTVSSNASVADQGQIEMGRVMSSREFHNLPLVTLNPYTFVFLQSNVTGNRTAVPGIGFPNVHANGFSRRGSYLVDGDFANDVLMGGVRLMYLSRAYVQEVNLTTSGMPAEFGATTGLVMNAVTSSGTNDVSGSVGYQLRRHGFSSRAFNTAPSAPNRQPTADVFTAAIGGPLIRDRWHYYLGFEAFKWDLVSASRMITISEANRRDLIEAGIPAGDIPHNYDAPEIFRFFLGRTDFQLDRSNRLALRYLHNGGTSEKIGVGAAPGNTLQLTQDFDIRDSSLHAQLVSHNARLFNEFRIQRSARTVSPSPNEHTGQGGVTVRVTNVASFGAPPDEFSNHGDVTLTTVQNNLSILLNKHTIKIGGGIAAHKGLQKSRPSAVYRFATLQHYRDARNGINPRGYIQYEDTFGDPSLTTAAVYWNGFLQDEWNVRRNIKVSAGLRYDLFGLPRADPTSPYPATRDFNVDKNNFGPRVGAAIGFGRRHPAVLRLSAGVYYDPPILNYYVRSLRNNGSSRSRSFTFESMSGPAFPNRLQSFPSNQEIPLPNIEAIDPKFKSMSAIHTNVQIEKAITEDLAVTAAYSYSAGRHIPTSRQVNCRPTGQLLADGRPIYGNMTVNPITGSVSIESCVLRILPQFRNIFVWESAGNLRYDALALKLEKRFSRGYLFNLSYTLARSVDDAPEENITISSQWQSDPSNRHRDRALSFSDQRHTFAGTLVSRPRFRIANRVLSYVLNNNQLGMIARISSGERQNLLVDIDLNRSDGFARDRAVGIPRNFLKMPTYFNVDARFSREFSFVDRYILELFVDVTNITNTNNVVAFTRPILSASNIYTGAVDPFTGELRGPLPDIRSRGVTSSDSRRVQVGIKFHF